MMMMVMMIYDDDDGDDDDNAGDGDDYVSTWPATLLCPLSCESHIIKFKI